MKSPLKLLKSVNFHQEISSENSGNFGFVSYFGHFLGGWKRLMCFLIQGWDMCSPTQAIFLELARSFSDDGECLGRMLFVPLVINLVMMIIYDHQKMRWNDQPRYDGLGQADFLLLQRVGVVGQAILGRCFGGSCLRDVHDDLNIQKVIRRPVWAQLCF